MPYMDRSMFFQELQRNPTLLTRLATIVNGEVGHRAPDWLKTLNLETIFNRAVARGQSLAQVTKEYTGKGSGGYYPRSTFVNGAPRSTDEQTRFNERILKPVLSGSDVSTQKLGFAATGNASDAPGNTVASNGIRSGWYTKYNWLGKEVYVHHKPDNVARLEATRKGGPTPPADIPGAPTEPGITTDEAQRSAVLPGHSPDHPAGSPDSPFVRPQIMINARPQAQPTLADRMIAAMGPRGAGASSYIDPNTGHQILNPGGSGEEAMGITRDLGRPGAHPFFSRPQAPAPQRTGPQSPPDQRPATGNPPAGPVPPRSMSFDPTMFDVKPIGQQRAGLTGGTSLSPADFSLPNLKPEPVPVGGAPIAPDEAARLAADFPFSTPKASTAQTNAPVSPVFGGKPLQQAYQPTTVGQQMLGLSPFETGQARPANTDLPVAPRQMQAGLLPFSVSPEQSAFRSTTILPFDQWPPVGWGWQSFDTAGPYNFGAWG